MKAIKTIGLIFILVVLLGVGYIIAFVDVNDFKPQITDAAAEQTGRQLLIKDDIELRFFPSLGITMGGIELANAEGVSDDPLFYAERLQADVELLPLLKGQLRVGELIFSGIAVNMITLTDGRSSLDGMVSKSTEAQEPDEKAPQQTASTDASMSLAELSIEGILFENARIVVDNQQQGSRSQIDLNEFRLQRFSPGVDSDFSINLAVDTGDNQIALLFNGILNIDKGLTLIAMSDTKMNTTVSGKGFEQAPLVVENSQDMQLDLANSMARLSNFKGTLLDINMSGALDVDYGAKVPNIALQLDIGDVDLDALAGSQPKKETAAEGSDTTASTEPEVEPDLSALSLVNFEGKVTVTQVKAAGLTTNNWKVNTELKDGVLTLSQLSADLYEGTLLTTATLDATGTIAKYRFDEKLTGVQIQPLMKDFMDMDFVTGSANIAVKGSGSSLKPTALKKNLLANGNFKVTDGSLYGINIPQKIREGQAALKGDFSKTQAEQKTDFTALTGSFSSKNGVITNPDLLMVSPLLRVSGDGDADIVNEQVDYTVAAKVVGSLDGQGGNTDMKGLTVPINIKGSFNNPKIGLDSDSLMKQRVDEEKNKLKDKLFKRFGG
ncbi:AsmA family protein [Paraferrimonas haliotis]|uniref:Cell envelope biogenesis protein AsmA n=1 Tax=Paraferrimonas haliotis TaxID=2013866 RepID=A0AA37WZ54_9GAMM|nr:AsmA family protein [Paraferrimonas haliotis]GLS84485.1 cell envelope biogenesis protein AsmA [Paraferrimonas haliotis]